MYEELLTKLSDTLSSIDSGLSDTASSLDRINKGFEGCMSSLNGSGHALAVTGDVYTN